MSQSLWHRCLSVLQEELPAQQFSMWIRPLQCVEENNIMTIYAPNRFVLDWVREKYVDRINELVSMEESNPPLLRFDVGSLPTSTHDQVSQVTEVPKPSVSNSSNAQPEANLPKSTNVFFKYTFDNFVEGK